MVWSGSLAPQPLALAPHFANKMQQLRSLTALVMHLTRYSLGHGLLLLYKLHMESPGGYIMWCFGRCTRPKINMPAVSTAPCIFFQPFSSLPASLGSTKSAPSERQTQSALWAGSARQGGIGGFESSGTFGNKPNMLFLKLWSLGQLH